MDFLLAIIVIGGLAALGCKVGRYLTLLSLVILTAVWGLILSTLPRETLAVVISMLWMIPGGAFVLGAWIGYLLDLNGAEQAVEKVFGLFLKDPKQ